MIVYAMGITQHTTGVDNVKSLANLATLYHAQSQYATAEPLYKRSLAIREKTVGPEHPYVGAVLQEMSRMYL